MNGRSNITILEADLTNYDAMKVRVCCLVVLGWRERGGVMKGRYSTANCFLLESCRGDFQNHWRET